MILQIQLSFVVNLMNVFLARLIIIIIIIIVIIHFPHFTAVQLVLTTVRLSLSLTKHFLLAALIHFI
jgi:hypothetical protein